MKTFAWLTLISGAVALISVVIHNLVNLFFGVEEPFFFVLSLLSPPGIAVGLLGCLGAHVFKLLKRPA